MQGSIINRIMENSSGQPYVGMPVTVCHYSDRSVGIITEVSPSGRTIKVAGVKATRVDNHGMSECQTYEYGGQPVDTERTQTWTLRKNGAYRRTGESLRGGAGLCLGVWDAYYDYSF